MNVARKILLGSGLSAVGVFRSVGFVSIVWFTRLAVQLWVFDAKPFLTCWFYRYGYYSLTGVFVFLALVYGWAAVGLT